MSVAPSGPTGAERNIDAFHAGVTACLRSWSALKTAVESGWGGPPTESHRKAEELRSSIYQHMDGTSFPPRSMPDVSDLEDALAIYMEEEFSVVLEDGSERQVADVIWRLYGECFRPRHSPAEPGNDSDDRATTFAHQLMSSAESAVTTLSAFPQQVQANEFDGDDDDDDEMDDDEAPFKSGTAQEIAGSTLPPSSAAVTVATHTNDTRTNYPAVTSLSEYASRPLFGNGPPLKNVSPASTKPVRQLGEAITEEGEDDLMPDVDEEGFASVVSAKKGRKRTPK